MVSVTNPLMDVRYGAQIWQGNVWCVDRIRRRAESDNGPVHLPDATLARLTGLRRVEPPCPRRFSSS